MSEKLIENNKMAAADRMGTAPLFGLIIKMSLPSMFSMMVYALYNVVDSIFVSRLGEFALSAVSIVYPVQVMNIAFGVGTSVGLSSLISRRLGEKNLAEAKSAANHGILICFFEWIAFIIFGLFCSRWFCSFFSDSQQLLDAAVDYCTIVCIGSGFAIAGSSLEKIMQGSGNMIAPMWCNLAGAITNIVLDPIMIFGYLGCPALGVAGAAYATVIGQVVSFILFNVIMAVKKLPVRCNYKPFKPNGKIIKDIAAVGFPAMVMQAISSVTTLCLNAILVTFSSTGVAVLGVYFKLQSFVFMPVIGMNHGLLPIMGYNYGAKNKKRLMDSFKYGLIIAFVMMMIGTMLFKIFPAQLMGLFDAEGDLLIMGKQALSTISWCFPFAALSVITVAMFQATAHGFYSMFISILRQLIVIVPLAFIFSKIWGIAGIWWAYPIAEMASLIVTSSLMVHLYRTDISKF